MKFKKMEEKAKRFDIMEDYTPMNKKSEQNATRTNPQHQPTTKEPSFHNTRTRTKQQTIPTPLTREPKPTIQHYMTREPQTKLEKEPTTNNEEPRKVDGTNYKIDGRKEQGEKNKQDKHLRTLQNQKKTALGTSPKVTKRKRTKPKTLHLEDGINTLKAFLELKAKARQNGAIPHTSINGHGSSIADAAVPLKMNIGEDKHGKKSSGTDSNTIVKPVGIDIFK